MTRTFQLHGDRVLTDAVVAAGIASDAPLGIGVRHGWRRVGEPMLVTASAGNRVHTLDDRPALDAYLEHLGVDEPDGFDQEGLARLALTHPLGLSRPGGEEQVRFIGGGDFAERSLICIVEVPQGALVWIMEGDAQSVLEAADGAGCDSLAALEGHPPQRCCARSRTAPRLSSAGGAKPGMPNAIGTRFRTEGQGIAASILHTGRPARTDRFEGPPGSAADWFRRAGAQSGIGSPIVVEGRLWGLVITATARPGQLRPPVVFAAVAEEVGRLLPADLTLIGRYDPNGTVTGVGGWSRTGNPVEATTAPLGGRNVTALVFETGRAARLDSYASASGAAAADARERGIGSAVGAPISVEGRLWGVMIAASTGEEPLPAGTEGRLADFTELVATAIANAEARRS